MTDPAPDNVKGLRSVLQFAWVYEAFQRSVGKNLLRQRFVAEHLQPEESSRILDVGCGPGDLVPFVDSVDYIGYDISQRYIDAARAKYGDRASFLCGHVEELQSLEHSVDQAVAIGVLHHVPDDTAFELLTAVKNSLKPGGRFVALEPYLYAGQHWIARELIKRDRGQFVREENEYTELCRAVFDTVDVKRDEGLLRVPYTLSAYTCS